VHIHGHGVELFERRHGLEQQHHDTATLDGLHSASQQVGCQRLKVLKDAHAERITQDSVCFFVVAIADICRRNKQLERVLLIGLANATLNVTFDAFGAFLGIAVST
jgi:hypothetical protein